MPYIDGLVSVIIPTYKRSTTIVRAVESVLNQTYDSIECLVVNDNEKNDEYSLELYEKLRPYTETNKVELLEQEHHKNGAAARNHGIKHAKGEYIAFLDDDDWWVDSKIFKEVEFIRQQNENCGAVSTLATYYRGNQVIRKTSPYKDGKVFKEIMAREFDVITCSLLMKHTALDDTGYFDENLKRHQEIQLLGYFTEKYSLALLPEYLTCVSVDDAINRPDAKKLKEYKNAFFKSVEPLLMRMSAKDRRYVKYMHKIELINLNIKEKKLVNAFEEGLLLLSCPWAFIKSIKRAKNRIREMHV